MSSDITCCSSRLYFYSLGFLLTMNLGFKTSTSGSQQDLAWTWFLVFGGVDVCMPHLAAQHTHYHMAFFS